MAHSPNSQKCSCAHPDHFPPHGTALGDLPPALRVTGRTHGYLAVPAADGKRLCALCATSYLHVYHAFIA